MVLAEKEINIIKALVEEEKDQTKLCDKDNAVQHYRFTLYRILKKLSKAAQVAVIILLCGSAHAQVLTASWYSKASLIKEGTWKHGPQKMANGGEFNENKYRAASWDYALGTRLKVSSVVTGRSVIVTVTDRTARRFKGKRIDLSRAAMEALGGQWAINKGLLNVKIEKAG